MKPGSESWWKWTNHWPNLVTGVTVIMFPAPPKHTTPTHLCRQLCPSIGCVRSVPRPQVNGPLGDELAVLPQGDPAVAWLIPHGEVEEEEDGPGCGGDEAAITEVPQGHTGHGVRASICRGRGLVTWRILKKHLTTWSVSWSSTEKYKQHKTNLSGNSTFSEAALRSNNTLVMYCWRSWTRDNITPGPAWLILLYWWIINPTGVFCARFIFVRWTCHSFTANWRHPHPHQHRHGLQVKS